MKTAIRDQKIKELEWRISILEGMPWGPSKRAGATSALEGIYKLWARKPRTRQDLQKVRRRLWGKLA